MKILKIKIEGFRSIKAAEIFLDDMNVFVGQNNHEKTNIFEAIRWFFSEKGSNLEEIRHMSTRRQYEV